MPMDGWGAEPAARETPADHSSLAVADGVGVLFWPLSVDEKSSGPTVGPSLSLAKCAGSLSLPMPAVALDTHEGEWAAGESRGLPKEGAACEVAAAGVERPV